jgi:hypothetical protein
VGGVAVMVDNFAIPAATIRGLFDYDYRADRLILRPRVPGSITQYTQKEPVRFGEKHLYLSCRNGGPKIAAATVNGKALKITSPDALALMYDALPAEAKIEITTEGGWPKESPGAAYPAVPALIAKDGPAAAPPAALPESLQRPAAVLTAMTKLLAAEPGSGDERAFVAAALEAYEARRLRAAVDPGPGYFHAITPQRKVDVTTFYEQTAVAMYDGFAARMARWAAKGDARQQRLAALFSEAQKQP